MVLTVGSFFTGVGMFDLGLRAAGMKISYQVEYDEFCQSVLRARANIFESPAIYGDIRECGSGRRYGLPSTDVIVGGFPCQPFSQAGKRQGEDDSRNMWPDFARVIAEIKPGWVILENVSAILIPNDGQPAYALTVLADLARMGYSASWGVISASDAGLPHGRERWFCVARLGDTDGNRPAKSEGAKIARRAIYKQRRQNSNNEENRSKRTVRASGSTQVLGNANRQHVETKRAVGKQVTRKHVSKKIPGSANSRTSFKSGKSRMGRESHGFTRWMDRPYTHPIAGQGTYQYAHEPARVLARKAPYTRQRLKALGNGGIPQIVYEIGIAILEHESGKVS